VSKTRLLRCATLFVLVGIFVSSGLGYLLGVRVNTTPSIPLGFYFLTKKPIKKGDYVIFCPRETAVFDTAHDRGYIGAGFCPGGHEQLMKRVDGVPGDTVRVGESGVFVNGQRIAASKPLHIDSAGRSMPIYRTTGILLTKNLYWPMGNNNPLSFDSRYFGPIHKQNIRGVIHPIYTWNEKTTKPRTER
jgi:conjugative transfer signal peptidase TraF